MWKRLPLNWKKLLELSCLSWKSVFGPLQIASRRKEGGINWMQPVNYTNHKLVVDPSTSLVQTVSRIGPPACLLIVRSDLHGTRARNTETTKTTHKDNEHQKFITHYKKWPKLKEIIQNKIKTNTQSWIQNFGAPSPRLAEPLPTFQDG